jgi:exodeoxyribonuclease-3
MKIATFNVNNVRRRLPNLLDWMRDTSPDVVCLQELKATDAEFPVAEIRGAGYEAIWRGQKTWNGVAKLAWLRRLSAHAAELLAARVPVVLAGDFNVVPTDRDIYPSKSWAEDALVQPASRAAYADLVQQGWLDAIRSLNPTEPMYTFWHYLRNRWERNAGLRIDHLLLSPTAAQRLQAAGVDRAVRGRPDASDHAPVWADLSDEDGKRRRRADPARSKSSSTQSQRRSNARSSDLLGARPLLVIDGDSFAHRSYHALPKSIQQKDGKGGGAIVGFANSCCAFTMRSDRERFLSDGTPWTCLRKGTRNFPLTRAVGSLTKR